MVTSKSETIMATPRSIDVRKGKKSEILRAVRCYISLSRISANDSVDWDKLQAVSQNAITMLANAIKHISNNIGADHGVSTNLGSSNVIPLASSISAGLMFGMPHAANEFSEIIWTLMRSREDRFFGHIIGHEHFKRLSGWH